MATYSNKTFLGLNKSCPTHYLPVSVWCKQCPVNVKDMGLGVLESLVVSVCSIEQDMQTLLFCSPQWVSWLNEIV